jgi:hypothetical protein
MQQAHAATAAELTTSEIFHAAAGVSEASTLGEDIDGGGGGGGGGGDASPDEVTARLFKRMQHCVAPATPATWSRYIDSRLKQFCTR